MTTDDLKSPASNQQRPIGLAVSPRSRLASELHRVRCALNYYDKGAGVRSKNAARKISELKSELKRLLDLRPARKSKQRLYSTKGRYRRGCMTRMTGGISKRLDRPGTGQVCVRWKASLTVNGYTRKKSFSEGKYGKDGARMLCALYRMAWMIEEGIWNPNDGDPFSILGAGQFFSGRSDMENTGCDYETMQQMSGALE